MLAVEKGLRVPSQTFELETIRHTIIIKSSMTYNSPEKESQYKMFQLSISNFQLPYHQSQNKISIKKKRY